MGPSKPALPPLKTPKSVTFPSELRENPQGESTRHREGGPTPISPPPAYTEFLRTFSPSFSSPSSANGTCPRSSLDQARSSSTSMPSSAMSTSFSVVDAAPKTGFAAMPSPAATPHSARELPSLQRLRIPDSASSPQTGRAIHSPFSPTEWRFRYAETPRSANGGAVSVRQTTTRRTITLRYTPPLDPPPKGKRRKTSEPRTSPRSP